MSSDQSQTSTSASQPETRLCTNGCGFFGSGATDYFCSKCFLERQKSRGCQEVSRHEVKRLPTVPLDLSEEEPMEVETPALEEVEIKAPQPTPKKKTKKASYKNMMAAMTKASGDKDAEKEKEQLRKVTGGGVFAKIDKI